MVKTLESGDLLFHRSTRPSDAVPDMGAMLIGTTDFAPLCYDARVYMHWLLMDGSGHTLLVWLYVRPKFCPFAD